MSYNVKKEKSAKVSKEVRILTDICKECGRYGYLSYRYCNSCWKEMYDTFNKEKKDNG